MKYFKIFSFSVLVMATTLFHNETFAAPKCSSAFFEEVPFGALRPEFNHTSKYSVEIPQTRMTNQCNLGTCHLYSWSNHFEANYFRRTGKEIHISSDYLSYMHFFAVSVEALGRTTQDTGLGLGASPIQSIKMIRRYGLRPESAFQISADFKLGVPSARAQAMIRNFVARVQLELQKISDPAKKERMRQKRIVELGTYFDEMFGKNDKEFVFEDKTYTSQTFAEAYFPELKQKITQYEVDHRAKDKFKLSVENTTYDVYSVDRKTMDDLIMNQIDQGKNVFLSYEHKHELADKATGIMSIKAFNIPFKLLPLPQNRRNDFKMADGGHAVQIVGYEKDPFSGELIKIKIKNSWGDKVGELGYFHMYADYLHTFVKSIITVP